MSIDLPMNQVFLLTTSPIIDEIHYHIQDYRFKLINSFIYILENYVN